MLNIGSISRRLLELSLTPDTGIRKQDIQAIFSYVASNVNGKDLTFDFARNNWDRIND